MVEAGAGRHVDCGAGVGHDTYGIHKACQMRMGMVMRPTRTGYLFFRFIENHAIMVNRQLTFRH